MKRNFFQAAVVSILLYGSTTWTLTKRQEKKLDGNYTRMLWAILNKSWRQHPTRDQRYGQLPPITKTIQVRRTRHAGHCWRSREELISDVLQWTPTYGRAKAGRPARTYIQQLCEDTGCSPEPCQRWWTIWRSGGRGSGISVLAARYDNDDDIFLKTCVRSSVLCWLCFWMHMSMLHCFKWPTMIRTGSTFMFNNFSLVLRKGPDIYLFFSFLYFNRCVPLVSIRKLVFIKKYNLV